MNLLSSTSPQSGSSGPQHLWSQAPHLQTSTLTTVWLSIIRNDPWPSPTQHCWGGLRFLFFFYVFLHFFWLLISCWIMTKAKADRIGTCVECTRRSHVILCIWHFVPSMTLRAGNETNGSQGRFLDDIDGHSKSLGFILETMGNARRLLGSGDCINLLISLEVSLQRTWPRLCHLLYHLLWVIL